MPRISMKTHPLSVTSKAFVFDLDTGCLVKDCVAVDTDEGWIETKERGVIHGNYEIRESAL